MSSRWDSVEILVSLPTACAVGYKYFVGFANWLAVILKLMKLIIEAE